MDKLTEAKLAELKASVPHCPELDDMPPTYVEPFAKPLEDGACLCCGERGTFTWGLVHGTGHCYKCGWPARYYHFVKDDTGTEKRIVRFLQYHPDGISLRQ